jgi:WD40 repeat protein
MSSEVVYFLQLLHELNGHKSFVNALCFDDEGSKLYSGDGIGKINVWSVTVTNKPSSKGNSNPWPREEIDIPELAVCHIHQICGFHCLDYSLGSSYQQSYYAPKWTQTSHSLPRQQTPSL